MSSPTSSPPSSTISSPPATQPEALSIQRLKNILRETVRVTVTDGRLFIGTFIGTDQPLNIILINTEEFRRSLDEDGGVLSGRYVGQVMVPWKLVVKVEVSGQSDLFEEGDGHDKPSRGLYF